MHYSSTVAFALAPLALLANAQAVDLDMDDVPTPCKTICGPIGTLSDKCDVDLRSDIDKDENHLQNQCICTNKSFDVAKIAAMCADCMHQSKKNKKRDDDDDAHADSDDLKDIDQLLSICGFSSTTYNSAATSDISSITVDVTRPTDISQLTTTLDSTQHGGGGSGDNTASATSSGQSSQSTSMGNGSGSSGSMATSSSSTQVGGGSQQGSTSSASGAATSTTNDNAGVVPSAHAAYAGGLAAAAAYLMG